MHPISLWFRTATSSKSSLTRPAAAKYATYKKTLQFNVALMLLVMRHVALNMTLKLRVNMQNESRKADQNKKQVSEVQCDN